MLHPSNESDASTRVASVDPPITTSQPTASHAGLSSWFSMSESLSHHSAASEGASHVMKSILKAIPYHAMRTLIELETHYPVLETGASSSERMEFFTRMINTACSASFSRSTICAAHNAIVINERIKNELLRQIDLNQLLAQCKSLNRVNPMREDKNPIHITPFTTSCIRPDCHQCDLEIKFSRNGYVAYLSTVELCSIYLGICRRCKNTYGPTSVLDPQANRRHVTVQSLQYSDHVYFSNSLIHAHTTFEGFAASYTSTLTDLRREHKPSHSANAFAKRLEVVWLYYEMSRLIFVASCETSIALPKSFRPESRLVFFERNLPFLFHVFTVFWSRHNQLKTVKCKPLSCSRVMLIDGHQKSRRVICGFANVTNTSHPEMGPVVQGCPYPPERKRKNEKAEGR
jgi:hypothetical protein